MDIFESKVLRFPPIDTNVIGSMIDENILDDHIVCHDFKGKIVFLAVISRVQVDDLVLKDCAILI